MEAIGDRTRTAWASIPVLLMALAHPAAWAHGEEWYDAYDCGLKALKQRQGARAVQCLQRAIRRGPTPGDIHFTYGTNRLETYYPYLRLAEAYLLVGNPKAAQEALAASEAQGKEPATERARLMALVDAGMARWKMTKPEGQEFAELVRMLAERVAELEVRLERLEGRVPPR